MSACGSAPSRSSSRLASVSATRYPIVLHHGLLGFDRIFFIDYFYQVKATLTARGYQVAETHVAPVNTVDFRTRQLKAEIDQILDETGAEKVDIIAHSMGGLDVRHLISAYGYGDRIGALVTIGTPHHGTRIADVAYGVSSEATKLMEAIRYLCLGDGTAALGHGPIDIRGAIGDMTTNYMETRFNPNNPDDPRVVYESYEGTGSLTGMGSTNYISPLLALPYAVLKAASGANDGLVPVASARYGRDRGTIPADHINEIGQILGRTGRFQYRSFYLHVAQDLAAEGL